MAQSSPRGMGMDGHKEAIAVASVAQDQGAEVTYLGTIGTRHGDSDHRSRTRPSKAHPLLCVSDAGPGGDWRYQYRSQNGYDCWVVAPAVIPQNPGDRVNTDRRDAVPWARLARSGKLTAVSVPNVADDALRALPRTREAAIRARTDAQWRLNACWLRHAIRDTGRATGGAAHLRWLSEVVCPTPAPPIVVHAEVRAVPAHRDRLPRLEPALHAHRKPWRLSPLVEALQAWRGVQWTVAVTRVAAMGDLTRVERPRERRKCLGLLPAA